MHSGLQLSAPQSAPVHVGGSPPPGVLLQRTSSGGGAHGMPFAMSLGSGDLGDFNPNRSGEPMQHGKGGATWSSPTLDHSNGYVNGNAQMQANSYGVQVRFSWVSPR